MLTRIQNDLGAISIDENIINERINDIVRSFDGNVHAFKNGQNRKIQMTEDGVFVHVELLLKLGTSISEVSGTILNSLQCLITEQLELPLSNIEVQIVGMTGQSKVLRRDILYDFKNGLVRWNEQ